jgi:hypothetical protein
MTDIKSGRVLAFEETRSEISVALANERRAVQAPQIAANLRISE